MQNTMINIYFSPHKISIESQVVNASQIISNSASLQTTLHISFINLCYPTSSIQNHTLKNIFNKIVHVLQALEIHFYHFLFRQSRNSSNSFSSSSESSFEVVFASAECLSPCLTLSSFFFSISATLTNQKI